MSGPSAGTRGSDLQKLMDQVRMLEETVKRQEKEIGQLKSVASGNSHKILRCKIPREMHLQAPNLIR